MSWAHVSARPAGRPLSGVGDVRDGLAPLAQDSSQCAVRPRNGVGLHLGLRTARVSRTNTQRALLQTLMSRVDGLVFRTPTPVLTRFERGVISMFPLGPRLRLLGLAGSAGYSPAISRVCGRHLHFLNGASHGQKLFILLKPNQINLVFVVGVFRVRAQQSRPPPSC